MLLSRFSKHMSDQNWFAVGLDVMVVVVGILIGLQVNNWNDQRKNLNKEQEILHQLKKDFEENLIQLDQKIAHRKLMIQSFYKIFSYIDNPTNVDQNTFITNLNVIIGTPTYEPIENNLINSGDIGLIKNKRLKRLLITWPRSYVAVAEVEKIWHRTLFEDVIPRFVRIGILRDLIHEWWSDEKNLKWILDESIVQRVAIGRSKKMLDTTKFLQSIEIEGVMSIAMTLNVSANIQSQVLRTRILEILELLNQEINKK